MQTFEPDPHLLETLARLEPTPWSGRVWRHTFADNPPDKANGRGARWNPPGTDALYASLERDTALAEAEHQMASQPIRPKVKRTIHQLDVELSGVLDLTDPVLLEGLGVDAAALSRVDFTACQMVGGAAAFLGHDGILVPSGRHPGVNLVVFVSNQRADADLRVIDSEVIDPGRAHAR